MGDRWWNYLTKLFISIFAVVDDVTLDGMTEKWFAMFLKGTFYFKYYIHELK